jgi:GTP-binding protein
MEPQANDFYRLGRGKLIPVSAKENQGKQELLDLILERLPPADADNSSPVESTMKVAMVGRRNTGKSTLVNTLAHSERMITSEVAGTTRDSVDVRFELDGKAFVAIDTPGLRRRKSISTDIDFYSLHRAQRSIRRADVVLLFFDPMQTISKVDKQLADYISSEYKPCVFVVNKWDLLAESMTTDKWVTYLRDTFRSMLYVPIAFITGQTGKNVKALINHAQMLYKQSQERISTADLNKLLKAAVQRNPPSLEGGRRPKIYYATQVGSQPPTIVLFCNEPRLFKHDWQRYLLGVFRDHLPFGEVPIKLYLRRSMGGDHTAKDQADLIEPIEDEADPIEAPQDEAPYSFE